MGNGKRLFWSAVISAVLYNMLQMFVHSFALSQDYAATASLWRPQAEMKLLITLLGNAVFGVFFAVVYVKGHEPKSPVMQGMRFGALMWTIVGLAPNLVWYAVAPWPGSLIWKWIAWSAFQMLFLGTFVAVAYDFRRPRAA